MIRRHGWCPQRRDLCPGPRAASQTLSHAAGKVRIALTADAHTSTVTMPVLIGILWQRPELLFSTMRRKAGDGRARWRECPGLAC